MRRTVARRTLRRLKRPGQPGGLWFFVTLYLLPGPLILWHELGHALAARSAWRTSISASARRRWWGSAASAAINLVPITITQRGGHGFETDGRRALHAIKAL